MKYYPINLDIRNRNCLVVGAGQVGTRKVKGLIDCGAVVTVVSLQATQTVLRLAQDRQISLYQREYQSTDMQDRFLVIGATDDEALNRQIHADAQQQKVLCNIADRPAICNFILPAVVQRGDLIITASTSGQSPAFAKRLRKELQQSYGDEYARFLALMGAIREKLLQEAHEPEAHKPLFEALIDGGLIAAVKREDVDAIDKLLHTILGSDYSYMALMSNPRTQQSNGYKAAERQNANSDNHR